MDHLKNIEERIDIMEHISSKKEKSLKANSQRVKRDLKKHKDLEMELSNSTFSLKKDLTSNEERKFSVFERTLGTSTSDLDTKCSQSSKSIKRKYSEDSDSDINKTTKSAKVSSTSKDNASSQVKDLQKSTIPNPKVPKVNSTEIDNAATPATDTPIDQEPIQELDQIPIQLTKSQKKKMRHRKQIKSKALFELMVTKGIVNEGIKEKVLLLKCINTNKECKGKITLCVMKVDKLPIKEATEETIDWKVWIDGTAGHSIFFSTLQVKDALEINERENMPYDTVVFSSVNNLKSPSDYSCLPIQTTIIEAPKKKNSKTDSIETASISSNDTIMSKLSGIHIEIYCSICKKRSIRRFYQ